MILFKIYLHKVMFICVSDHPGINLTETRWNCCSKDTECDEQLTLTHSLCMLVIVESDLEPNCLQRLS